ncbi:hypothetical protein EI77_02188 [Prosthecobacter fusiformis]|uniref:Uncharacterized protein n=1 Tax=Prosthecobacter fusiformis TaxID=48464 RepID=A0A4R7RYR4_9BACT|nr:hypothetical protein EI77_02188 [Prosthecobacter fusiformis]
MPARNHFSPHSGTVFSDVTPQLAHRRLRPTARYRILPLTRQPSVSSPLSAPFQKQTVMPRLRQKRSILPGAQISLHADCTHGERPRHIPKDSPHGDNAGTHGERNPHCKSLIINKMNRIFPKWGKIENHPHSPFPPPCGLFSPSGITSFSESLTPLNSHDYSTRA